MRMEASVERRAFRERVAAWNQAARPSSGGGGRRTDRTGQKSCTARRRRHKHCRHIDSKQCVRACSNRWSLSCAPGPTVRPTVSACSAKCDAADTRCAGHDTRFLLRRWGPPDAPPSARGMRRGPCARRGNKFVRVPSSPPTHGTLSDC